MDSHAGQIHYRFSSQHHTYHIEKMLSKSVFRKDYPENPKTFGEHLRKARIDAGLRIKDLAKQLGVTEDSVINWELRGMRPRYPKKVLKMFPKLRNDFPSPPIS